MRSDCFAFFFHFDQALKLVGLKRNNYKMDWLSIEKKKNILLKRKEVQ